MLYFLSILLFFPGEKTHTCERSKVASVILGEWKNCSINQNGEVSRSSYSFNSDLRVTRTIQGVKKSDPGNWSSNVANVELKFNGSPIVKYKVLHACPDFITLRNITKEKTADRIVIELKR